MKKLSRAWIALILILVGCGAAHAEIATKMGASLRLRNEFWRNFSDASDETLDNRNMFRIKSSFWGQLSTEEMYTFYLKMTNEFRAYTYFPPSLTKTDKDMRFDINEMVFDNFYMDVKNVFDMPVDIRLGRQDFLGTYGEGFLIMDGTPQDGSRTFYFNALKAAWRMNETNGLDFVYIRNTRDEEYLPVINEDKAPQNLNTTDEEAYVLYWKNKDKENLPFEAYYIYKREDDESGRGLQGEKGIINTMGGFGKYIFDPWTLRGQMAGQFGSYGEEDRQGMGGYLYLDKDFKEMTWTPKASLGYMYLSGDDVDSAENEAWDPLFSRYPWISELYVLSMGRDTGVTGYWTNLMAWRLETTFKTSEKTKLLLAYNYLRAAEETATTTILSGDSLDRGHLFQTRFDYAFTKNITAYLLVDYLLPGDFYVDDDSMLFTRVECQIKF